MIKTIYFTITALILLSISISNETLAIITITDPNIIANRNAMSPADVGLSEEVFQQNLCQTDPGYDVLELLEISGGDQFTKYFKLFAGFYSHPYAQKMGGRSLSTDNVHTLLTNCPAFKQMFVNAMSGWGLNMSNIDRFAHFLPFHNRPFTTELIGQYFSIEMVVANLRAFNTQTVNQNFCASGIESDGEQQQVNEYAPLGDRFMEYLNRSFYPDPLPYDEQWFRQHLGWAMEGAGSFEKKMIYLMQSLEVNIGNLDPRIKNAIDALSLEHEILEELQESIKYSNSKRPFDNNTMQTIIPIIKSLALTTSNNPMSYEDKSLAILQEIKLRALYGTLPGNTVKINDQIYPADSSSPASPYNVEKGRVMFHLNNAIGKMLLKKEFLSIASQRDLYFAQPSSPQRMIAEELFKKVLNQSSGSFSARLQDFYMLVKDQAGLLNPKSKQLVLDSCDTLLGNYASGQSYASVVSELASQGTRGLERRSRDAEEKKRWQTHFNPQVAANAMYSAHPTELMYVVDSAVLTNVTVLNEQEVQQLFNEIKNRDDIPFRYPADGCFARAHLMADYMAGLGINSMKIFSQSTNPPPMLYAETPNHPSGGVSWRYHVAPVIFVRNASGESLPQVIDPSINKDRPVTPDEWMQAQTVGLPPSSFLGYIGNPQFDNRSGIRAFFSSRYSYKPLDGHTSSHYAHDIDKSRQVLNKYNGFQTGGDIMKQYFQERGIWQSQP
ncbi:MAG: hypothetical protein HQK52_06800 [Oligoflexia bacterium]|nr:hypothetical protein [Oligoflexia bacterium]